MYKLIRRYFGELCDKINVDDTEVFDEDVCFENRNFGIVESKFKEYLFKDKQNNYVVDEETKKLASLGEMVRLFFDYQENWNNYIEMFIVRVEDNKDSLEKELESIVENYDKLTEKEKTEVLLELEDKYETHYQKLKNAVVERVIRKRLKEFKGSRTINNNTFISFVRDLENQFECEIDLIDLSVRFNVI